MLTFSNPVIAFAALAVCATPASMSPVVRPTDDCTQTCYGSPVVNVYNSDFIVQATSFNNGKAFDSTCTQTCNNCTAEFKFSYVGSSRWLVIWDGGEAHGSGPDYQGGVAHVESECDDGTPGSVYGYYTVNQYLGFEAVLFCGCGGQ